MMALSRLLCLLCLSVFLGGCGGDSVESGLDAFKQGRYPDALRIFSALAEQGDGMAQYYLGRMHETGTGVAQDFVQAARFYQSAADQGVPNAQGNLAVLYAHGRGVERDFVRSYVLSSLAATGYARWSQDLQQMSLKNRDEVAQRMSAAELYQAQRELAEHELRRHAARGA